MLNLNKKMLKKQDLMVKLQEQMENKLHKFNNNKSKKKMWKNSTQENID